MAVAAAQAPGDMLTAAFVEGGPTRLLAVGMITGAGCVTARWGFPIGML